MSAPAATEDHPLRRNHDFNLLWVGQVVSDLGGNISAIAFPLLVLTTTGSPAKAGIVAAARSLPELGFAVPAGALVDRWNQKRVMIIADCARAAALGSLALAVALDALAFGHIVAVALVDIVIERERGASATLIGVTFAFVGVGGLLGSLAAPWLARRVSMRAVIIATAGLGAALLPLLLVLPGRATPGIVFGAMWILNPLWSTVVGAHRLRITPPELRARILSIATLISGVPVQLASVAAGVLLETAGTTPTVIVFSAIMVVGAAIAVVGSRAVRDAPARPLPIC